MRGKFGAIFGSVLLIVVLFLPGGRPQKPPHNPLVPSPAPAEDVPQQGEGDVEARNDWFTFQRTYPHDSIPPDARQEAWVSVQSQLQVQEVSPAALTWQSIGPAPTSSAFLNNWGLTSGRINSIAISPANSQLILLGTATGGIFRSSDGGSSFRPVSDDQADLAVGSIAFSRSNPQVVYAGMGDPKSSYLGTGVLRSNDGGRNWERVSDATLPTPGNTTKLVVDPGDSNRLYVAQTSRLVGNSRFSSGFYYSTNGGVSWTRSLVGIARDLVLDVTNPRTIYGAMARVDEPPNTIPGIFRSTDGGVSWTKIFSSPYPLNRTSDIRVATTPANPQVIYVYTGGTTTAGFDIRLYVSTDSGLTWTNKTADSIDPNQFGYNTYLEVDPSNADNVFAGSRDLYRSTDAGGSWANQTRNFRTSGPSWGYFPHESNAHPDQHALAFAPNNPNHIYIGNDGGLYKSTDRGNSFSSLNSSLNLAMFVSLATHPQNPSISYGGTQDNGTQRRLGSSQRWQEFVTGDGGKCLILPTNSSTVFTTYIRGTIYRFSNNTGFFDLQVASNGTFGEPDVGARIAFYAPFTTNGRDSTLYFGTYRLFMSTDFGLSWNLAQGEEDLTKGITMSGADVLNAIGVGPENTNIIYTGSRQGRTMVSTDGGGTWTDRTGILPDRTVTGIVVDPDNSSNAYLTTSGFNSGHVFKTTDAGATWTDISNNLPDVPANALLIDPYDKNLLYLGTDIGMFRSMNGGQTWTSFNDGLPPVIVTAITSQVSGLIQIATYGRGAYEMDTSQNRPFISLAEYNGGKLILLTGGRFASNLTLYINGVDKSEFVKKTTGESVKIKGKRAALDLQPGDNFIKVVSPDGFSSNNYRLILQN